MLSHRFAWVFGLGSLVCLPVLGQSVISAHSGVLNFSEGSVFIDGQPVEQKVAKFSNLKPGSELRTETGRAEVLLTPGVFLRIGDETAVRMISNSLTDTRVEFIRGSGIVECTDTASDPPVRVTYKDYEVRIRKQSVARFDGNPPELRIAKGEVEVSLGGKSLDAKEGQVVPFSTTLVVKEAGHQIDDSFDTWAKERSSNITADNQTASKLSSDPNSGQTWQDSGVPDPYSGGPLYVPPYIPPANNGSLGGALGSSTYYSLGLPSYYPFGYAPGFLEPPIVIGIPYPVRIGSRGVISPWQPRGIGRPGLPGGGHIGSSPSRPTGVTQSRPTAISHPTATPHPIGRVR